jgi:hypothetical protein
MPRWKVITRQFWSCVVDAATTEEARRLAQLLNLWAREDDPERPEAYQVEALDSYEQRLEAAHATAEHAAAEQRLDHQCSAAGRRLDPLTARPGVRIPPRFPRKKKKRR